MPPERPGVNLGVNLGVAEECMSPEAPETLRSFSLPGPQPPIPESALDSDYGALDADAPAR